MASYPPLFAFVVFKNKSDANEALAALNNTYVCGFYIAFPFFKNCLISHSKDWIFSSLICLLRRYIRNCRVRVSVALPRVRAHDRYRFGGYGGGGGGGGYYGGGGGGYGR